MYDTDRLNSKQQNAIFYDSKALTYSKCSFAHSNKERFSLKELKTNFFVDDIKDLFF